MLKPHYDVIVIGGGPAGSMTSYYLSRAGLRVVVLDAKKFPREKACGGGLQARAAVHIPFDLTSVIRGTMRGMALSFGLRDLCTRMYPEPLVYSVLRSEFDHFLLQRTEEAGSVVRQGVRVRHLEADGPGPVLVYTDAGTLTGHVLVGADGANSVVRPLLNRRESYFWQAAVYCEIPEDFLTPDALANECMRVDWGTLPSGYAWIFPKRGYVNIGAGGPTSTAKLLRAYVSRFIETTRLVKPQMTGRLKLAGHQLPTLTRGARVSAGRILLVGDAAGLVEPFTGDGISFACHSAEIAAQCIHDALRGKSPDLSAYSKRLRSEIAAELAWSRKLLALSVAFPGVVHRLFRQNETIWQIFCRILRGEDSFQRLKKEILGPLEFGSRIIEFITTHRERKALARTLGLGATDFGLERGYMQEPLY
jgi:geranylgeranyl reductase family protein